MVQKLQHMGRGLEKLTVVDFGLGRTYNWVFHVVDVTTPILGIDFLSTCKFNINVHNASVTDERTNVSIRADSTKINDANYIPSVLTRSSYLQLLNEFPALLSDKLIHPPKHNIVHRIRLQDGPFTAGPDALALTSLPQSNLLSQSCSPTALSRSAAHLGAALFTAYPKRTTHGALQATTGLSTTSPSPTLTHCLTCSHLLTNCME